MIIVSLLERYVFSIAFLGSLLFSGGRGPRHPACSTTSCLAGRQARCWFLGEKAVACSACSTWGELLLSVGFQKHTAEWPDSQKCKTCPSAAEMSWEFLGERESWLLQPCKTEAGTEPFSPACRLGWLLTTQEENILPVSWEKQLQDSVCWTTAPPGEFRSNWNQGIPREQTSTS